MTKIVAILGSSRADGDKRLLDKLRESINFDIVDLNDYNISYYDYEHKNRNDDYLPLMEKLITNYDTFIMATPVYWYAMSGIMKVFFDRVTNLLDMEKNLGRKLRGKSMTALSCSVGENLKRTLLVAFLRNCYLSRHEIHRWCASIKRCRRYRKTKTIVSNNKRVNNCRM
jgi:multimeric flavodoxin WrbA